MRSGKKRFYGAFGGEGTKGDNFVFFHAQTVAVALQVHKQTRVAYHESKNTWGESPKVTKRG